MIGVVRRFSVDAKSKPSTHLCRVPITARELRDAPVRCAQVPERCKECRDVAIDSVAQCSIYESAAISSFARLGHWVGSSAVIGCCIGSGVMPRRVLGRPLLLVPHRPNRRSIGHIGDVPAMVRSFHRLSIVVRQREVQRPAGLPGLGLWADCTKNAWRIPGS